MFFLFQVQDTSKYICLFCVSDSDINNSSVYVLRFVELYPT